ncbi:MAG: hypothetical protein COV01_03375 [Candidatus Taylorbacteria bacterium CG10_big_fil_rev_8_21_14_0_10_41_48]|uniref:Uncharacterized protein n=1 Tax=Candidatus Taylorbacteria bacterium CG10_big_fil_rev_8_21_14_0_10_41_48 TaxID=1975024 RepID=A0A2M8LB92_9BACT|nr:MAG: hypothetical protein COV01_03375 [Candidatus Taylorbacteria bacterium CG10_big_fil_rev_8_21_14_0_10_41_48]
MAYIGRYSIVPLKNKNQQSGPCVEYGVVSSIGANGVGRIKSHDHNDEVIFSVRGACHAIVKNGRPRFESLFGKGAHAPSVGLEVAFIAGYAKPGDSNAIAEVWSSKVSWEKARAEARGPELKMEASHVIRDHSEKWKARGKTGRGVSKVVQFPKEEIDTEEKKVAVN